MRQFNLKKSAQKGFTLLELLVVVAILALVAGGLLVSYDGLDAKAAKGQATFNLSAIDKGVRAFKVVSGGYPDKLDNLVEQGGANGLAILSTKLFGKLGQVALDASQAAALTSVGITTLRGIPAADNSHAVLDPLGIPNRIFDSTPRGKGVDVPVAATAVVSVVEAKGINDFAGGTNADSKRLRDITGLDITKGHVVVALGLGNQSSIVSDATGANAANFSEAPFYTDVKKNEYGRFTVLFHVSTDVNDDGDYADAGETFGNARFVGVIDSKGDWLDEEFAEFTGQKVN